MTPTAEIHRVLQQHPGLGAFGFGSPPPDRVDRFTKQVDTACRWITQAPDAKRLIEKRGAYPLKHACEQWAGERDVPTGALIVAAVLNGFEPVHGRYPGPNCRLRRAP